MPSKLPSVNLLKDNDVSSVNKFIDLALKIGRVLVITVEIITIVIFVYRFALHKQLSNLRLAAQQRQDTISSLENSEAKYTNLQDRISLIETHSEEGTEINQAITDIEALVSKESSLKRLSLNENQITVKSSFASAALLSNLINSLRSYNGIQSISIDSIENEPSSGLSVNITAVLK